MRTIAIAQKVIKELLRDKRTLALMFVAPVFIMWLMNLMFSASTTVNVKLATQDLPNGLDAGRTAHPDQTDQSRFVESDLLELQLIQIIGTHQGAGDQNSTDSLRKNRGD